MKKILDKFELSERQLEQFDIYYKLLIEYNKKCNLTAITEQEEVYVKHFYDSLMLSEFIDLNGKKIVDVGSGAGFPSIPLKILFPELEVVIVEALKKRVLFLNELCESLGIKVDLVHGRAEEYSKTKNEEFDFATARAVAKLNVLSELCMPFLKIGGTFICMKSQNVEVELNEAKNAIKLMGGELESVNVFELPNNAGARSILKINKIKKHNNKYPRQYAQIKNKPL